MKTILTKIKQKSVLFENIQNFVGIRHYILPYIINKDKILQNQLTVFNGILKDNKLSSNFINNLFKFISDRILFKIINEEKDIFDDSKYILEEDMNKFQILKKRIFTYYKSGKYFKDINININDLKRYIPNNREFALFLFDFLVVKNNISSIFTNYNLKEKNDIYKFLSYYDKNINLLENKENINQISNKEIENIYFKLNRKVLINLAFVGNKRSGKSTTLGHLLYGTGFINQNDFIRTSNYAQDYGRPTYKYSWLIDYLWAERTYVKTIIYHLKKFETKKYDFNLIDLPGDFHLRKNIIKGISLADAVVVIVTPGDENSEKNHIKDYLIIIYTMGIRQLIIAINEMDITKDEKYSEKIYLRIKKNMLNLCINIGFNINNIQFIPYSGYTGQNLINKYEDEDTYKINKMNWYKGKTLLESFDEIKPPIRFLNEPLKISIINAEKISGVGTVFEGKILSGILKPKMQLIIPLNDNKIEKKECESIEIHLKNVNEAIAGDLIGFHSRDIYSFEAKLSSLVFEVNAMDCVKNNADNLRIKILMIHKKSTLKIGSNLTLYSYSLRVPIKIKKIEYLIDGSDKILEKEPKEIKNGEYAIIIINLIKKDNYIYSPYEHKKGKKCYFFEKYSKNHFLGSVELLDNEVVAIGSIKDINI